jgi:mannose-6-phosphate isomerase-like protein (cupin superfamily)
MSKRIFVAFFGAVIILMAQQPEPYSQLDPKAYDPKVDVNMEMFMSNWRDSAPRVEHGSLVVRDIFTKLEGEILRPSRRGAVLTQFSEYAHGTLYPDTSTTPSVLKGEQKVFYIDSGRGTVTAGGKTAELHTGVGVFIPANLEFTMKTTGDEALEMYIIGERIPDGFTPRKDMLVRDESKIPIGSARGHWVNATRPIFGKDDGFAVLLRMGPVWLDPMTMSQPHASRPLGTDILWVALRGDINTLLGKRLFKLRPGTAFKNPSDGKVVHANINVTDEPIKVLWVAGDRKRAAR